MQFLRLLAAALLLGALSACAPSKFRTYDGPEVTRVVVYKAERQMELWHYDTLLRSFDVDLGGDPFGHKQREGDRRTPEGDYIIDRRNPNSRFHLSIGIDYPNEADRAFAQANGWRPGGDIFIHGRGPRFRHARGDWTDGCIAVTDREMEDIYAMVRIGTPISILPARPLPEAPVMANAAPLSALDPVALDAPAPVTDAAAPMLAPAADAVLPPADLSPPPPPEKPGLLRRLTFWR